MVEALLKNLGGLSGTAESLLNGTGSKADAEAFIQNYKNQGLEQVLQMMQSKLNIPGISMMPGFDQIQQAIQQMDHLQQLVNQIKSKHSL